MTSDDPVDTINLALFCDRVLRTLEGCEAGTIPLATVQGLGSELAQLFSVLAAGPTQEQVSAKVLRLVSSTADVIYTVAERRQAGGEQDERALTAMLAHLTWGANALKAAHEPLTTVKEPVRQLHDFFERVSEGATRALVPDY